MRLLGIAMEQDGNAGVLVVKATGGSAAAAGIELTIEQLAKGRLVLAWRPLGEQESAEGEAEKLGKLSLSAALVEVIMGCAVRLWQPPGRKLSS